MKNAPLLAATLALALAGTASAQVDLSPARWPAGEAERVMRAATSRALVEHSTAMIAGTTNPLAVRAGREALQRGGSAVDAAITTALAQVVLAAGSYVSFAGFMNLVYYEAGTGKVHTLRSRWPARTPPALTTRYYGLEVSTMPLPNVGGGHLLQGLNLLEAADLAKRGHVTAPPMPFTGSPRSVGSPAW